LTLENEKDLRARTEELSWGAPESRRRFQRRPRYRTLLQVAGCVGVCLPLAAVPFGSVAAVGARQSREQGPGHLVRNLRITPVEGDSWLRHLGIPFAGSNMGRVGLWGPPPSSVSDQRSSREGPDGDFLLSGADLYRLNCRSCHKPDGGGVPPEINSIIGPVQATSPVMIRAQMKQRGIELDAKSVNKLASQAQTALRARLQNGGEKMPPFRHLAREEVSALMAYIEELAGIPGAERKQIWLSEPAARVGELLIKGNCHICHEATGSGLAIGMSVPGVIPSLASLARDKIRTEVIRKVREGLSRPMPMMLSDRGEMPIFSELEPAEVGAAYAYLVCYPPRP
jgi:mono/diheme cytochrome c family protein